MGWDGKLGAGFDMEVCGGGRVHEYANRIRYMGDGGLESDALFLQIFRRAGAWLKHSRYSFSW